MTAAADVRRESPVDVPKPGDADARFWSVTTILKVLSSPALEYWACGQVADAAIGARRSLQQRVDEDGEANVRKWLIDSRFRKPKGKQKTATQLGSEVHAACETYAITGERPAVEPDVAPFIDRFEEWCDLWQPEYTAAEVTVYSPLYGFAGTADGFLKLGGLHLIIDYKTADKPDTPEKVAGPYSEVALQLAAYRHAELAAVWRPRRHEVKSRRYYLLDEDERELAVPVPEVDGGLVIHLTPYHCHAYPVRCDQAIFDAFLYVLEAARWDQETSRMVIGDRLVHPAEVAAA